MLDQDDSSIYWSNPDPGDATLLTSHEKPGSSGEKV